MTEYSSLRIRQAVPADWELIADFNCRLARETENLALKPASIAAGVQALLADERHGRYLLAEIDGRPIGQLMHTREWSDWRNGEFWWLQSVYVHPDFRRRGVFHALMKHLMDLAQATPGIVGLRLYMADDNQDAQRTYEQSGFQFAHYVVLERLLSEQHAVPKCSTDSPAR